MWGFALLSLVLYFFALVFVQGLIEYRTLEHEDDPTKRGSVSNFGSFGDALLSLYMSVSGGQDWNIVYKDMQKAGTAYAVLFALFVFFCSFAVFNLITGLI